MTDPRPDVSGLLRAEGIEVIAVDDEAWSAAFFIDGEKQTVLMLLPPELDYYLIFSIASGRESSLDELSPETLRKIIRMGSTVPLAKVEYFEAEKGGLFAATSECSTKAVDGPKLHRRMEACARLAAKIHGVLASA